MRFEDEEDELMMDCGEKVLGGGGPIWQLAGRRQSGLCIEFSHCHFEKLRHCD